MRCLLLIIIFGLFSSCDALVRMPYVVKNKTLQPLKLDIKNYSPNSSWWESGIDTVIVLQPGNAIVVASKEKIDFPWGTKNIYRNAPGVAFDLMLTDTTIAIGNTDTRWKYRHKNSVFKITKTMLKK